MKNSLSVNIDLSDVFSDVLPTREQSKAMTKQVLTDVTMAVIGSWKQAAGRELKSTRANYLRSLYIVESGRLENSVVLGGSFNNMLESGVSAFDMKLSFAKSSKKKTSKAGTWYLSIPFRFASPGALGESEAFSGVLPKSVAQAANKAGKTYSGKPKGVKAINLPDDLKAPKSRATIETTNNKFEEYKHKSSIYEGVTKTSKSYEESTQSQYNSFRTVSENSDSNAFIHPGLQAGNFAEKGLKTIDVDVIVENSIDSYLSKI